MVLVLVSVVVSVGFSFCFAPVRAAARKGFAETRMDTGDFRCATFWCGVL